MKDFLKFTLASMVGFILANIIITAISIIIFLATVGSIMSMAGDFKGKDKISVKEKSVLQVELDYPIAERTADNPFKDFQYTLQDRAKPVAIREILKSIENAKQDDKIKGIVIETSMVPNSFTKLEEVRDQLKSFKESGKFVYAYSNIMTQKGYYVASVADSIFLQPEGMMNFDGLVSESPYFKGLFDKLGIEPHVFKIGKYKSATEAFTRKEMSEANRKQTEALLGSILDHYLEGISESRGIGTDQLMNYMNEFKIWTAESAVEHGLADKLIYHDKLIKRVKQRIDQDQSKDLETVTLEDYTDAPAPDKKQDKDKKTDNKVAVIYATGPIGMGQGDMESVGASRVSKALRKAREDDDIKSIVFRVNSPGGSALASDVIWREAKLAAKEKPLVVSMGYLAASGGYYIAAPADTIIAQPNTITGSIGVYGMLFNWQDFWNEKTGITFDRVKKGKYADFGNPNRPITEKEKQVLTHYINKTYNDFVSRVAEGRNMSKDMVDSFARGRVWSGLDAQRIGLVDMIGGFEKSIQVAADMADVEDYKVKEYPEMEDPFKKFFEGFSSTMVERLFASEAEQKLAYYKRLKFIHEQGNGIYMLMPYDIKIE